MNPVQHQCCVTVVQQCHYDENVSASTVQSSSLLTERRGSRAEIFTVSSWRAQNETKTVTNAAETLSFTFCQRVKEATLHHLLIQTPATARDPPRPPHAASVPAAQWRAWICEALRAPCGCGSPSSSKHVSQPNHSASPSVCLCVCVFSVISLACFLFHIAAWMIVQYNLVGICYAALSRPFGFDSDHTGTELCEIHQ